MLGFGDTDGLLLGSLEGSDDTVGLVLGAFEGS